MGGGGGGEGGVSERRWRGEVGRGGEGRVSFVAMTTVEETPFLGV